MPAELLSIVVVSFNTRELLRRCLLSILENPHHRIVGASLADGTGPRGRETRRSALGPQSPVLSPLDCQVIVVDNASRDGSADMVEREFPAVRLLRSPSNLGFSRATNLGLGESRGELLLLLNPDTEVVGDALVAMADFLRRHGEVAAVGPALVFPDGRPQHGAFQFPNLWMSLFDFFPLNHRIANSRLNGRYRAPDDGRPLPVDHPLGAALMLTRRAMEDVGTLDESFFMYCEEIDWCLRAKQRGWQIYQIPSARVVHHVAQSTRQFREEMFVELHRSRYRLFRKHYSPGFLRAHRAITRAGLIRQWLVARWEAWRGRIDGWQLERRLAAYRAVWRM